ncbi:hypothetical protein RO3G_02617 [Rhizopus delemar RA 99-880]|uniref:Uncharacterized protein n=1 Tax=Rhizopus delemar (strain RA 99-880 / ATCC MYA-4621 / FGSC 9543 / NRRL 43880) TaxID=246409 RepID=I1BNY3_RHIO9|nr:hypothetical protein RO3G_02617 [Rhizopus delemar RA 99-880]|eukprot:EIE77913.1 hypothetical protein RO3G_02617 [Rhizopus delemar RA 99-880]
MHEELGYKFVIIKDSVSRQKGDGFDLPEKCRMTPKYDYNKKVKKVDWFHPAFFVERCASF